MPNLQFRAAERWRRIGGWSGLVGSILFMAVVLIEGALRDGYDPVRQLLSDLSLGPRGWIQIANFLIFGVLFLLHVRGLTTRFGGGAAIILLALIGLALALSGPFVTDPETVSSSEMTLHGKVHLGLGIFIFLGSTLACALWAGKLARRSGWQDMARLTMALALVMALGLAGFVLGRVPVGGFAAWSGLFQRLVIGTFLFWTLCLAVAQLRRPLEPPPTGLRSQADAPR